MDQPVSRFMLRRQGPVYKKKRPVPVYSKRRKSARNRYISTLMELCYHEGKSEFHMAPHLFLINSVLHPFGPVKFFQSDKSVNCRYFLRNDASPQGIFSLGLHKKAACPPPCASGSKRLRKRGPLLSFSPKEPQRKLDGSRNVSLTECHFSDGGPLHLRVKIQSSHVTSLSAGSFPQICSGRQKQGGSMPGCTFPAWNPLVSCLAKRPSLHFSRDVDARWAGAHVHTRQNAAFWLGWAYESVACPPVFIALAPEMEA